jgi:hypothetical protein
MTGQHTSSVRRARIQPVAFIFLLSCSCVLGTGLIEGMPRAQAQSYGDGGAVNREYPLKALFLYNFGNYVEWPADEFKGPGEPFVIGVLGTSAMDSTLSEIVKSKRIADRRIDFERFTRAADVTPCQILFISRTVPAREAREIIGSLRGKATLIVGETRNFGAEGGGINFFEEANKIRFEINLQATKEQRLKISSKLLAMAKIVQTTSDISGKR